MKKYNNCDNNLTIDISLIIPRACEEPGAMKSSLSVFALGAGALPLRAKCQLVLVALIQQTALDSKMENVVAADQLETQGEHTNFTITKLT